MLERLQFKNFGCWPTMAPKRQKSMPWSLHFEIDFVDITVATDPAAACDDSV